MPRNMDCKCLCHGSDGNYISDVYFSCKNCYASMHMSNLPRNLDQVHKQPKPARKPRAEKPKAGGSFVKVAAAVIMENIALAAEMTKKERIELPEGLRTGGDLEIKKPSKEDAMSQRDA